MVTRERAAGGMPPETAGWAGAGRRQMAIQRRHAGRFFHPRAEESAAREMGGPQALAWIPAARLAHDGKGAPYFLPILRRRALSRMKPVASSWL